MMKDSITAFKVFIRTIGICSYVIFIFKLWQVSAFVRTTVHISMVYKHLMKPTHPPHWIWKQNSLTAAAQRYSICLQISSLPSLENDRLSISEPNLTDTQKHLDRFLIKHPHEYISVDDLKFYRRHKPPDLLTKSHICFGLSNETIALPFCCLRSEYRKHFLTWNLNNKALPLRRATSLKLAGLMPFNRSEHQDCYLWYTPEDWKSCRTFPIRKPESLRLTGLMDMQPEYRSSFVNHPMIDRSMKILPREMFRIHSPPKQNLVISTGNTPLEDSESTQILKENQLIREKAVEEQIISHLQERSFTDDNRNVMPSEYKRQFIQFPIEKAHSIPQITHIKMQGHFQGVPEYQDCFKMYNNYEKPAALKKADNLVISGSEIQLKTENSQTLPEYQEKFHQPPGEISKEKSLKTQDHLHVTGDFGKDVPEYYESFQDPQIKQMPERGKCREPYLHLKGKIEFNPEYRNTYLDFPRSRPIVPKPKSTFRLPTTTNINISPKSCKDKKLQKSPTMLRKTDYESNSNGPSITELGALGITKTPEYRRASYNYQLRERSPVHKTVLTASKESKPFKNPKTTSASAIAVTQIKTTAPNLKERSSHQPKPSNTSFLDTRTTLDNLCVTKIHKTPKFGRRASALRNADNCREKTSIIEGNPKYNLTQRQDIKLNADKVHDSFLVLGNKSNKRSHWG
uniref:Uncharacterized protein n=1 Tax=Glossina brevipalpis TaxID=37001 RepID=A0A1A9WP33_9MUSC